MKMDKVRSMLFIKRGPVVDMCGVYGDNYLHPVQGYITYKNVHLYNDGRSSNVNEPGLRHPLESMFDDEFASTVAEPFERIIVKYVGSIARMCDAYHLFTPDCPSRFDTVLYHYDTGAFLVAPQHDLLHPTFCTMPDALHHWLTLCDIVEKIYNLQFTHGVKVYAPRSPINWEFLHEAHIGARIYRVENPS